MTIVAASKWVRVNRRNPCQVCSKPDWCLISKDGKAALCARIESDKPAGNKGAGWIHTLDDSVPLPPIKPGPEARQASKATTNMLNTVYHALLSELSLSELHRENLQHRGLDDVKIESNGYGTLLPNGRRGLITRLQAKGVKLAGIPGFYLEAGYWHLSGPSGIAIPVRDTRSRIVGLQIRCDNAEGGRYKWLSSRGFNVGCSPGTPIHVSGNVPNNSELWITEGVLKADIAALKLGRLVLAVAGVGNWSGVIPIIRELRPERVIVAFDMDKVSNSAVKLHTDALMTCLIKRGIRTFEANWDTHFKGLDDLLTGDQSCQR
ncbi:DUF3854 domain-containing protein [Chloroflexota bacterium]